MNNLTPQEQARIEEFQQYYDDASLECQDGQGGLQYSNLKEALVAQYFEIKTVFWDLEPIQPRPTTKIFWRRFKLLTRICELLFPDPLVRESKLTILLKYAPLMDYEEQKIKALAKVNHLTLKKLRQSDDYEPDKNTFIFAPRDHAGLDAADYDSMNPSLVLLGAKQAFLPKQFEAAMRALGYETIARISEQRTDWEIKSDSMKYSFMGRETYLDRYDDARAWIRKDLRKEMIELRSILYRGQVSGRQLVAVGMGHAVNPRFKAPLRQLALFVLISEMLAIDRDCTVSLLAWSNSAHEGNRQLCNQLRIFELVGQSPDIPKEVMSADNILFLPFTDAEELDPLFQGRVKEQRFRFVVAGYHEFARDPKRARTGNRWSDSGVETCMSDLGYQLIRINGLDGHFAEGQGADVCWSLFYIEAVPNSQHGAAVGTEGGKERAAIERAT